MLYEYQIFPVLTKLLKAEPIMEQAKIERTVPAYKRSAMTKLRRLIYKVQRHYLRVATK